MRKIAVRFNDFDADMVVEMEERNREICDDVWSALPFTCVLEHAMVSGHSIYGWVPMLTMASADIKLLHSKSPVGTVSYLQGTGNKIGFKYGEINEDLSAPVLGYVAGQYHGRLAEIGRTVWFNYFYEKAVYTVIFNRVEENVNE